VTEERQVETAGSGTGSLVERVVRQMGLSASVQAVFGPPVEAHGRTVIPVARVYFLYGAGLGPELAGRTVERPPDGRLAPALSSGGGGGGMGIARPAGYIEMGPEGTRFVPATRDWKGMLALVALAGLGLALLRWRPGRGVRGAE
jgi:uncharacterized spore protein YtfJ